MQHMVEPTGVGLRLARALHATACKEFSMQDMQRASEEKHSGVACVCPEFEEHVQRVIWLGFLDKHYMRVTFGPMRVKLGGTWPMKLGHHAYDFIYKVKWKKEICIWVLFSLVSADLKRGKGRGTLK